MQLAELSATCCEAGSLRMTVCFFEEGRSAIVVTLRFKSFSLGRGHRLGVGSFKGFECEVVGYKRMQNGAGHQLDRGMSV